MQTQGMTTQDYQCMKVSALRVTLKAARYMNDASGVAQAKLQLALVREDAQREFEATFSQERWASGEDIISAYDHSGVVGA